MCNVPGIPEDLHCKGREKDNLFLFNELIYRRFKIAVPPADWEQDKVTHHVFPLQRDSYNRSSSSEPSDVLFNTNAISDEEHFRNWGIISLPCSLIIAESFSAIISGNEEDFILHLEHTPEECMYPHLEMLVYIKSTYTEVPDKPKKLKIAIRYLLNKSKKLEKEFTSMAA